MFQQNHKVVWNKHDPVYVRISYFYLKAPVFLYIRPVARVSNYFTNCARWLSLQSDWNRWQ